MGAGGVTSVAGTGVEDALRAVLAGLGDRPACPDPSYQVAETVARYGTFDGNPLLAPLTERQRDAVEAACACPPRACRRAGPAGDGPPTAGTGPGHGGAP
ncbi:hypothetical protein [Streptomyces sp. CNQ085]|uniref:hypothetical protein n=1 Tax=Streptomyces sp. CNQ085 TaxID=2886944 RepID=UPI001F50B134|nr:hypothetical protein [Streptomyces sp. CNQ085]MCI0384578.1 hypothetical protein [Streptomyces sp. CNQ085]